MHKYGCPLRNPCAEIPEPACRCADITEEQSAKLEELSNARRMGRMEPRVTFLTDAEREAILVVLDFAARHCGGGEDRPGALLYTGAFRKLEDPPANPPGRSIEEQMEADRRLCRLIAKLEGKMP